MKSNKLYLLYWQNIMSICYLKNLNIQSNIINNYSCNEGNSIQINNPLRYRLTLNNMLFLKWKNKYNILRK